jgi:hypothetical protein
VEGVHKIGDTVLNKTATAMPLDLVAFFQAIAQNSRRQDLHDCATAM